MIQQLDDHHQYFIEGYWTMAAERDNWGQDCLLCWILPNHSCALRIANVSSGKYTTSVNRLLTK